MKHVNAISKAPMKAEDAKGAAMMQPKKCTKKGMGCLGD